MRVLCRRAELEQLLVDELGLQSASDLTPELLEHAARHTVRQERQGWIAPEQLVIAALGSSEASLHAFVRDWRQLFMTALSPRHLPLGWTLDHRRSE